MIQRRQSNNKKMKEKRVDSDQVKKALITAQNTIRKKFRELHNRRLNFKYQVNEEYKPITEPLKKLVEKTEAATKATVKKEKEEAARDTSIKREKAKFRLVDKGWPSNSVFKTAKASRRAKFAKLSGKNTEDSFFTPEQSGEEEEEDSENAAEKTGGAKANVSGVDTLEKSDDENVDGVLVSSGGDGQSRMRLNLFTAKNTEEKLRRSVEKMKNFEALYGFRAMNERLLLGNAVVKVKGEEPNLTYEVNDQHFPITPGLTHLLLENVPRPESYNDNDLEIYKEMLVATHAHKTGYNRAGHIKRHIATTKYNRVIKKLFPPKRRPTITGDGLANFARKGGCMMKKPQMSYKSVNRAGKFNYTYWDDPNELVDRLRILTASKSIGHTGHENEMISIVEELREAKIIK